MSDEKWKMNRPQSFFLTAFIVVVLSCSLIGCNKSAEQSGSAFYVDSVAGDDTRSGLSLQSAWKSLPKVNATIFSSGDKILFKSGSSWTGQLWPKGSGREGAPIIV